MKSIVLLSGGLDSLVSLAAAKDQGQVILALNFDYGQKSAKMEKNASEKIAKHYGVPFQNIKLDWLRDITNTSLVSKKEDVPVIDEKKFEWQLEITCENAKAVWVPNRNGVFVHIAASFAESLGADTIVAGFNSEEAATFPDNSLRFVNSANQMLRLSTLSKPKVISYVQSFNKTGIINMGLKHKVPFELIYSCYVSDKEGKMCGKCESCARLRRAFKLTHNYELIRLKFADEKELPADAV